MDANTILKKYETAVYLVLITLFAIIVAFSIGELIYILYNSLFVNSPFLLENNELLGLFGYFLLVLIGVELLATVAAYVNEKVIRVEVVILIAIIAIARNVILLDPTAMEPLNMFGISAIIFALCSGYFFLKKAGLGKQD
ncbi:MAG: phosphate-starvation-inducible PsiE family protein [Methanoregula sp.]|uniref:phosphate-starvation-inducible PsiE family protein n=1 Tax=Methanoregula sp. TaxID=2052170 RepID=UPI003BAF66FF